MAADDDRPRERSRFLVDGIVIHWLPLLLACFAGGLNVAGFAILAMGLVLSAFFARIVTVTSEADGIHYAVTKLWGRQRPEISVLADDAVLWLWEGPFSCGLELRGSRLHVVAVKRESERLRLPSWMPMGPVARPRIYWNLRATLSNLAHVLLLGIAIVAVRDVVSWISAAVVLLAGCGILSSLAAALAGAPRIAVMRVPRGPSLPEAAQPTP